jgi:hypothetical protein
MVPENDAVKINKNDVYNWTYSTGVRLRRPWRRSNASCAKRAGELHNPPVMQMKPGTPERLEVLRKLEVSCRAEVKLRRKALAYYIPSSQCRNAQRAGGA